MVQRLLVNGAYKDAFDDSESAPLYLATEGGHVAAALALVTAGADIGFRCGVFKWSVAHEAAKRRLVEILEALIAHGVDVNSTDTPHQQENTPRRRCKI